MRRACARAREQEPGRPDRGCARCSSWPRSARHWCFWSRRDYCRALLRLQNRDPGFRADHVLTLRTSLPFPRYEKVQDRAQFYEQVLRETRALPGVTNAAYISFLPMAFGGGIWQVALPGHVHPDNEK